MSRRLASGLSSVLAAIAFSWAAMPALSHADGVDPDDPDSTVIPGVQPAGPGPHDATGAPKAIPRDEDRAPLRGVPVEHQVEESDAAAMRAFEQSAFGRPDHPLAGPAVAPRHNGKDDLPPVLVSPPHKLTGDTPPEAVRPDLPWLKGLKTGDLPVRWDPRVIEFLQFYRDDPRGHRIMADWLRAQGRYKSLIVDALRKYRLPEDLLYVAMIESSYDPLDTSYAGASGLWQFMPEAGRIYGLDQNYWVDERNDPEKANDAQMYYFRDLIDRFGNWHLALTAFNCGYGAVLKSLAKYGTNDFWALLDMESGLPWESSIYVPKILAAAVIGHNPEAFGFGDVVPDPPFEFDRVSVPKSTDLSVIARAAGVDFKAVHALNPELRRGRTPPAVKDFSVRIPKGTREKFASTFPQMRGDWDNVDAYVLRHGERFEDVARTFGVSPAKLRDLNGVTNVGEVRGGTIIVVPKIDAALRAENRKKAEDELYHSDVVPGAPDEPLLVAVKDKDLIIPHRDRVFYRVVPGDSLDEVSAAFGVPGGDIAEWNGLDPEARLQPRMVLEVWVDPKFDAARRNIMLLDDSRLMIVTAGSQEHLDLYEGRKGRVREKVVAKSGDTLDSIGRKYHLTQYDMARINHRSYGKPLEPGEELLVYRVVDLKKAEKAGVFKNSGVQARTSKKSTSSSGTKPKKK